MSKIVPIDFEYNTTAEAKFNLVCCSFEADGKKFSYWLYENEVEKLALKGHLLRLRESGHIFLAFNVVAEGRAFISLGIDPTKCKWIDLQAEWKMLINHYNKYAYGKQLIDGKEVFTTAPDYGSDRGVSNAKPPKNLAGCIYKLLEEKIDTDHKNEMRDIIIRNNPEEIRKNQTAISDYCDFDIKYLKPAWQKIREEYLLYFERSWKYTKDEMEELGLPWDENDPIEITYDEVLYRGESVARTALIEATGYPVSVPKVKKFAGSVKQLLKELCEDINGQFPEEERFFRWNSSLQRYSMYQKPLKEWIKNSKYADNWLKTPPSKTKPDGDYSLSLDAWEKHFSFRHDYPRGSVGGQMLRYLKTRQSLNGFLPKGPNAKNKETFFDSLGSDGRVRSYLNPYGSATSRFQPKATGFLPLKASWMRSMIQPAPGRAICGIDYGSQEFLIAALVANDENMIKAYESGDVYLYFAKLAGAVPWDGKKEDYKKERNVFKSTTLGISYSMGAASLARKLSDDTGIPHTQEEAQELINKFMKAYPAYAEWIENIRFDYSRRRFNKLKDGWITFGGNTNKRSVSNGPIQGFGGCILRMAIKLCQENKLKVIFPLHDALYIEYPSMQPQIIDDFADQMRNAFSYYFEGEMQDLAHKLIRLDANIWSPDYTDGEFVTPKGIPVKRQKIYIDERSESEYERFKKYMGDE